MKITTHTQLAPSTWEGQVVRMVGARGSPVLPGGRVRSQGVQREPHLHLLLQAVRGEEGEAAVGVR